MRRLLTLMILVAAGPAPAAGPNDRGKKLLPKLFEEVVAPVADATVRVLADGKPAALGTIMSADGYILTKGSELKGTLTVKMRDGSAYDAEYVGYHRETDLALLKVDAADLVTVTIAPSKVAEPGNWVAVAGITSEPVAVGVISSAARKLFGPDTQIVNANKGYIGIQFPRSDFNSLRIDTVVKGAAAEKAKLKAGDVIVEVGGTAVKSRQELMDLLDVKRPGDKVMVKVRRAVKDQDEPEQLEFAVTLSPNTQMGDLSRGDIQNSMGSELSGRRTGFPRVIQHDTVVAPKDCGGPLVDLDGRVIGLNIARAGRVETWALAAEEINPVYKDLKAGKFPPPKGAKPAATTTEPKDKGEPKDK